MICSGLEMYDPLDNLLNPRPKCWRWCQPKPSYLSTPGFNVTFCSATVIAPHLTLVVNVCAVGSLFVMFTAMTIFWPTLTELDDKYTDPRVAAGRPETVTDVRPLLEE